MSTISSFIDFNVLPTSQPPGNKYGAIDTENFRVSSTHIITADSMAFAVTDGLVLVQPQENPTTPGVYNTGKVNLIIKPVYPTNNGLPNVKYFIYRGLKETDLFTGGIATPAVAAEATSNYVGTIWADFHAAVANGFYPTTTPVAPSYLRLGLDWIGNSGNNYNNALPIDNIFENETTDLNSGVVIVLARVFKGDSLGRFASGKIGFDVVIEDNESIVTLSDARKEENIIVASAASGAPGALTFSQMKEREKVLSFMDPVVLYMGYGMPGCSVENRKVNTSGSVVVDSTITGFQNIYTNVAAKFATKNTVYIDVRNELGYSINYFKDNNGPTGHTDFGKHIHVGINTTTLAADVYYQNKWPVYTIVNPTPPGSGTPVNYRFGFWRTYNPVPVIYADVALNEKLEILAGAQQFFPDVTYENAYLLNPSTFSAANQWSAYATVYSPVAGTSAVAWYIKLQVNRRYVPANIPNTALKRDHYLDNVFGPVIPLTDLNMFVSSKPTQWAGNLGKRYIYASGIDYIAHAGFMYDNNDVVFTATIVNAIKELNTLFTPNAFGGVGANNISDTMQSRANMPAPLRIPFQNGGNTYNIVMNPVNDKFTASFKLAEYNAMVTVATASTSPLPPLVNFYASQTKEDESGNWFTNNKFYTQCEAHVSVFDPVSGSWNVTPNVFPKIYLRSLNLFDYSTHDAAIDIGKEQTTDERNDPYIALTDFTGYLQKLEGTYVDDRDFDYSLGAIYRRRSRHIIYSTHVHLEGADEDTCIDSASRLRNHYYGLMNDLRQSILHPIEVGKTDIKGLLFSHAVSGSNLTEVITRNLSTSPQVSFRAVYLEELEDYLTTHTLGTADDAETIYRRLLSGADENGINDNPSPYLIITKPHGSGPQYIDIGHMLFAFEALAYAPNMGGTKYNPIKYDFSDLTGVDKVNLSIDTGVGKFFRLYKIYHAYDLAGLIGDIGISAAELFYHQINNKAPKDDSYWPATADVTRYFDIESPEADLLSDVDAVGLYHAYLVLKANNTSANPNNSTGDPTYLRLSDVFTYYYQGTHRSGITVFTHPDAPYSTVNYRWIIFCRYFKFVEENSLTSFSWLPVASNVPPSVTWQPLRDMWRRRMYYFMQFWYGSLLAYGIPTITEGSITRVSKKFSHAYTFPSSISEWEDWDTLHNVDSATANPVGNNNPYCVQAVNVAAQIMEDKFLMEFVKPNLENECSQTGISLPH